MLAILRSKLAGRNLSVPIHQMDVRALNIDQQFDLIFIPFHSFAELLSTADQRKTLARIREHLADNGCFICTLHNPQVRLKRADGQLRLWGKYPLEGQQGTLLFWGLENYEPGRHVVDGLELFEEYDLSGFMKTKRLVELHFRIVDQCEFEGLAAASGFRVAAMYGDYAYSEFQQDASPFMIWILRK